MAKLFANSEDPDQTPRSAASDLGLHCLPIPFYGSLDCNGLNYQLTCLKLRCYSTGVETDQKLLHLIKVYTANACLSEYLFTIKQLGIFSYALCLLCALLHTVCHIRTP